MWLKEGFEWDPFTGEKEVAGPELMNAAMEGRIEWDDEGGMRILDEVPRSPVKGVSQLHGNVVSPDDGMTSVSPEIRETGEMEDDEMSDYVEVKEEDEDDEDELYD
jgi:hypothetical protein